MLVFGLGTNHFLETSNFKTLSWIYIIRNSTLKKYFAKGSLEQTLHSPALLLQPRCCGILPCHLTPFLSALAAPWHGKAFPQFRHTKEQFPLRVECKKPVHTPGFCSQTVFNNYSAGTQYVWVPFSKSDYIWLRDVTGWKGQTGQTCMFMQCDSISHQRRTFICHLCDLFLFSSSTVC